MSLVWLDPEVSKQISNSLPIAAKVEAPPCPNCRHWNPVIEFQGLAARGLRLCHALKMHSDFSCFETKPEA